MEGPLNRSPAIFCLGGLFLRAPRRLAGDGATCAKLSWPFWGDIMGVWSRFFLEKTVIGPLAETEKVSESPVLIALAVIRAVACAFMVASSLEATLLRLALANN